MLLPERRVRRTTPAPSDCADRHTNMLLQVLSNCRMGAFRVQLSHGRVDFEQMHAGADCSAWRPLRKFRNTGGSSSLRLASPCDSPGLPWLPWVALAAVRCVWPAFGRMSASRTTRPLVASRERIVTDPLVSHIFFGQRRANLSASFMSRNHRVCA